jgi:MFS family permease
MHGHELEDTHPKGTAEVGSGPWYTALNRYHWFVLVVASLGWLFDCMDQRIFVIVRQTAMTQLLGYTRDEGGLATWNGERLVKGMRPAREDERAGAESAVTRVLLALGWPGDTEKGLVPADAEVKWFSGIATAIFMVGWAIGGLYFGVMGDRWGRAKTMMITIVLYSAFTGLSALSQHWWDFMLYRFITGVGVGGEFAAGVALVAEAMPDRARPLALGLLQSTSTIGTVLGSSLNIAVGAGNWKYLFLVGTAPALLVLFVMNGLKEPEAFKRAKELGTDGPTGGDGAKPPAKPSGGLGELLGDPRWLARTAIGTTFAIAGVVGLWGVGFWTPELIGSLPGLTVQEKGQLSSVGTILQDCGGFCGVWAFSLITAYVGRRAAFAFACLAGFSSIVFVFGFLKGPSDVYWMLPILGFGCLTIFGGFAIYFPELYPVRLRSTGTGFCYNAARVVAAAGPFTLGILTGVFSGPNMPGFLGSMGGVDAPFRYAAIAVGSCFLLGLLVIPIAPETKGKPLPE